jgi:putative hydrolase of the HAD superfamily
MTRGFDVLLLDFGGVCLLTPFELHRELELQLDLPQGSVTWMGPFDTSTDDLWRSMFGTGETLNERAYWQRRAELIGAQVGRPMDTHDYMRLIYEPSRPELVRPGANTTVDHALQSGIGVSVLTNDLRAFHGAAWAEGIPLLQRIDHLVDCSDTGVLKPDPRAYQRAIDAIGVAPERMLFVDDQPLNIGGAEAVGMQTLWFDVTNADASWDKVRSLIDSP